MKKARRNRKPKQSATMVALSVLAAASAPLPARGQTITCPQNLMFGTIMPCASMAADVTIEPDGSTSSSPGCVSATGTQLQGRCIVSGTFFPVQVMQISVTAPVETIISGGNDMQVNDFNLQSPAAGPIYTVTAFITSVNVGGTLNVDAAQAGGSYSGTVTVSVVYQ